MPDSAVDSDSCPISPGIVSSRPKSCAGPMACYQYQHFVCSDSARKVLFPPRHSSHRPPLSNERGSRERLCNALPREKGWRRTPPGSNFQVPSVVFFYIYINLKVNIYVYLDIRVNASGCNLSLTCFMFVRYWRSFRRSGNPSLFLSW